MEDCEFHELKRSFDALNDDMKKSCFLFCAMLHDSHDIERKKLGDYWIGEELVAVSGCLASHRRKASGIVEHLVNNCLLDEGNDSAHVRMHDTVRSMAVRLDKEVTVSNHDFKFGAGEGIKRIVEEKMERVKRASLVDIDTGKLRLVCPRLTTLLMGLYEHRMEGQSKALEYCRVVEHGQKGKSGECEGYEIHPDFFAEMPVLRVLDMTGQPVLQLPESIFRLKSLQYLNLSFTLIEEVPSEIGQLVNLRFLDLSFTAFLSSIPKEAISPLSYLWSLKLFGSSYSRINAEDQISLADLQELEDLEELELPLQDFKTVESMSQSEKLRKCVVCLQLGFIADEDTNDPFQVLTKFEALRILSIKSCQLADEVTLHDSSSHSLSSLTLEEVHGMSKITMATTDPDCWSSLYQLHISFCSMLEDITCLCQLFSLQILVVEECEKIHELVKCPEKQSSPATHNEDSTHYEHKEHQQCFRNLKSLTLYHLPALMSISDCNLRLNSLETISVYGCSKLEKLPVASVSDTDPKVRINKKEKVSDTESKRKITIRCEEEWWKGLKWETDNIKLIFIPVITFSYKNYEYAKRLETETDSLEDSMDNLNGDSRYDGTVKKVKDWITEARALLEQMKGCPYRGDTANFSESQVQKQRQQLLDGIKQVPELLSEVKACKDDREHGTKMNVESFAVGEDSKQLEKGPKEEIGHNTKQGVGENTRPIQECSELAMFLGLVWKVQVTYALAVTAQFVHFAFFGLSIGIFSHLLFVVSALFGCVTISLLLLMCLPQANLLEFAGILNRRGDCGVSRHSVWIPAQVAVNSVGILVFSYMKSITYEIPEDPDRILIHQVTCALAVTALFNQATRVFSIEWTKGRLFSQFDGLMLTRILLLIMGSILLLIIRLRSPESRRCPS